MVYNINHLYHLLNKLKMLFFSYNSDQFLKKEVIIVIKECIIDHIS